MWGVSIYPEEMSKIQKLKKRVIELKYLSKDGHIGSCLSALPIINKIYNKMKKKDRFILSSGHAGVALYTILENRGIMEKKLVEKQEVHPNRNIENGIWASTGSLGHGIGIAVGMAIPCEYDVYCLLSDGECAEGSVWEALMIAEREDLKNLHIYINANGWGGLHEIDVFKLSEKLRVFNLNIQVIETNSDFYIYEGLDAHYKSLKKDDYEKIICQKTI